MSLSWINGIKIISIVSMLHPCQLCSTWWFLFLNSFKLFHGRVLMCYFMMLPFVSFWPFVIIVWGLLLWLILLVLIWLLFLVSLPLYSMSIHSLASVFEFSIDLHLEELSTPFVRYPKNLCFYDLLNCWWISFTSTRFYIGYLYEFYFKKNCPQ